MASSQEIHERAFAARIDLLRQQHPLLLGGSLGASALMVFVLWPTVSPALLVSWAAASVAVTGLRFLLARVYDDAPAERRDYHRWAQAFTFGSGANGLVWGSLPLFFLDPADVQNVALISVGVVGIATGALGALAAHWPSYTAFAIPAVGLMAAAVGAGGHIGLAVLGLPFLIVTIGFSRNLNRSIHRSLELRFENSELVEALRDQRAIAEQANRDKSSLLAAASHDLRQPAHAMGFFVDALEGCRLDPQAARFVERIRRSLSTLDGLFHSLLEMSRLEAGLIEPRRRGIELDTLLADLVGEYLPIARRRGLRLERVATRVCVDSDPVLLDRMLRNLLSNALRYTNAGGVVLGVRRRGDSVAVEIRDTGPGMNEDERTAAFQAFRRCDRPGASVDVGDGLGLGLAIVGHLSRLLDHPLEVVSRPGRGSAFRLLLPRAAAPEPVPAAPLPSEAVFDGRQVLVIDDDPDVCDALQAALQRWGCRVRLAGSTAEALATAEPAPEVVIADYRLPDVADGAEVLRQLGQRLGAPVPAILITGDTAPERLCEARATGYPVLRKPVRPPRLRTALYRVLQESSAAS